MLKTDAFLARIRVAADYADQIVATRVIEARPARIVEPRGELPPALRRLCRHLEISGLYAHQAAAYDAVGDGEHVAICTGTASGKSLCYHLPVLGTLASDPDARALYLFPAKALAHDQQASLERMIAAAGAADRVRAACYDGDTPTHQRAAIRRSAGILLTNPDMLHVGILPYHAKWAGFFARLRYVVLDEIHTYRGIFGSHIAGVVRRLKRICAHYGSRPQFICCSATLGNPRQLAERLIGEPVRLIDDDGSPCGRKTIAVWNPPWIDGAKVGRRSGNIEAQSLMQRLLEDGAGTITFCKARVVAELIYKYVADELRKRRSDLAARLRPYRGGYLPSERREIEEALFDGRLLGVCSTSALELGIDVGSLDAAIVVGFPSTLCSFWQQAGRAGRRQSDSLVIFVAYDDPVDQYFCRKPEALFDRPLEHAIIDPHNPHILAAQLSCAAAELPLAPSDLEEMGGVASDVASALVESGRLRLTQGRHYWATSEMPAINTSLRTISNATFAIIDETDGRNATLGQVDAISAPELLYPEAVYLHQGESYLVRRLDQETRIASVQRFEPDYYTQPVLACDIRVVTPRIESELLGRRRTFGDVTVRWQTTAFKKIKFYSQELIGQTALDLPPQQINTASLWLQPPFEAARGVEKSGAKLWEALSGARNMLLVAMAPLVMSDRHDIGGIVDSAQLGVPTIFLYDRYEGGVGYSRCAFDAAAELLRRALELVEGCECESGCPACVSPPNLRVPIHHDPDLARGAEMPDKAATITLLRAWLNLPHRAS